MDTLCLVLLAMLRVSGCMEHIPITGNCSDDVSANGERLEVFSINKTNITCNVLKSEDCGLLPRRFRGTSVGRPRDFEVSYITVNRTVGYVPVAVFKWRPSSSGVDAVHLKGFQLEIRKLHGPAEYPMTSCRIFDLTGNNLRGNDNSLEFSEIFPGLGTGPDIQYRATICSLPRETHCQSYYFALPEVQGTLFVRLFVVQLHQQHYAWGRYNTAADWSPLITYRFSRNSRLLYNVEVTFPLAPTEYKFEEYIISMYKMSAQDNPFKDCTLNTKTPTSCNKISHLAEKNATSGTVIFENIPENRYMLEVQAIDPYWREDKYALCFSVHESGSHKRKECLRTRIKNIIIGNAGEHPFTHGDPRDKDDGADDTPTEPNILQTLNDQSDGADDTPTEPNILQTLNDQSERPDEAQTAPILPSASDNEIKTLIIATGICVCVGVLFAVILIFIFTRKKVQVKDERFPMRRVYLLAYDDHRAHTNAVEALATLLNKHCFCDVIYPKWFISDIRKNGLYEWIFTQMDKSDFVVLVNSKAAYWTYTAQNKDKYFRAGENDPFSFSTSHLRSKVGKQDFLYTAIMTYFNYTDSNDVIPFNPGLQYKLPENFPDLVNHIHGCNISGLGMSNILRSAEGKALVKAVDEAKAYQQKCHDWFSARVPESVQGLVMNPESKRTQVEVEPDNAVPSLSASSIAPYTYTLSETQALSVDGDEAVTLVLEDETESPIGDGPGSSSNFGMALQSSEFSPEYLYSPESYSESLCTEELEDRIFAITSKAF